MMPKILKMPKQIWRVISTELLVDAISLQTSVKDEFQGLQKIKIKIDIS